MLGENLKNAAGGLIVANISKNFEEGVELALNTIKEGKAFKLLERFVSDTGESHQVECFVADMISEFWRRSKVYVIAEAGSNWRMGTPKRDLAMVFQSYALYPHMSVYENMSFALKLAGESKQVIEEKVTRAASILNLTDYLDRTPGALSGGQAARFQILLLELEGSTLLLLADPTDNLDLASAEALEDGLEGFEGTVVAVTHDRWFARSFDRFLVFGEDGVVRESPEPVWEAW